MLIEVASPASLPLGLAHIETESGRRTCLLGVTLQHPPVHLSAQARTGLIVTGPRADRAYALAAQFRRERQLAQAVEAEIELAIPALMGLSSEEMLGLTMARALAWTNGLPAEDTVALAQGVGLEAPHALAVWGFDRGGFLTVDTEAGGEAMPPILKRHTIAHDDKEAWAFVLVLPRAPEDTPQTLASDRLAQLLAAAPHLSAASGRVVTGQLWPAVENDDLPGFAQALSGLQLLNREALAAAGVPRSLTADEQGILKVMEENGALASGQSVTGLALYALVKGASATVALRHKLRHHIGFFGGTAMATITDNEGARHVIKDENPQGLPR